MSVPTPYERVKRLASAAFSQGIEVGKDKMCYIALTHKGQVPLTLITGPKFMVGAKRQDLELQILALAGIEPIDWVKCSDPDKNLDEVCAAIKKDRATLLELAEKMEAKMMEGA